MIITKYMELSKNRNIAMVYSMVESNIDIIIGKNLRRLRELKNLSQDELAEKMGKEIKKSRISAIEHGREGMGKYLLSLACKALDAEWWQFYIEDNTPIITDRHELRHIQLYRQAKQLGIADQIREQEEIWIERVVRRDSEKTLTERADEEIKKVTETVNKRFGHLRTKKKRAG